MLDTIAKRFQPKPKADPTMTGVMGSVFGVAIGTAATLYFSKQKNRDKVKQTMHTLKNKAHSLLNQGKDTVENKKEQLALK